MADFLQTEAEPGVGSLMADIAQDARTLLREQLALLEWELKDNVRKSLNAVLMLGFGLVLVLPGVFLCGLMASHLLFWALPSLPLWACYGIVGVVVIAGGLGVAVGGMKRLQMVHPLPEKTAESLKENLQWILHPK